MTKTGCLPAYKRMESAVSGPTPRIASNCSRRREVGARNILFREPEYSAKRKLTNAFRLRAFWRKKPEERIELSKRGKATSLMRVGDRSFLRRRFRIADSTFDHAVC